MRNDIIMVDGYFINPGDTIAVEMVSGVVRRNLAITDEAMLCEFTLTKGAHMPEHSHMNDQVGYIVSGKIEYQIGGQTRVLESGDSYAIPGGVPHSTRALEDTLIIDVFSPPRKDYRTEAR